MNREEILQAVARGWCHPSTENRTMDAGLAEAIADEVCKSLSPPSPSEQQPGPTESMSEEQVQWIMGKVKAMQADPTLEAATIDRLSDAVASRLPAPSPTPDEAESPMNAGALGRVLNAIAPDAELFVGQLPLVAVSTDGKGRFFLHSAPTTQPKEWEAELIAAYRQNDDVRFDRAIATLRAALSRGAGTQEQSEEKS